MLVSADPFLWVFETEGTGYSRVNLFSTPIEVITDKREDKPGFLSAVGLGNHIFAGVSECGDDSVWNEGFLTLGEDENNFFAYKIRTSGGADAGDDPLAGKCKDILIKPKDFALVGSLLAVNLGNGGIAFLQVEEKEGQILPVLDDTLFTTFLDEDGILTDGLHCGSNSMCSTEPLYSIPAPLYYSIEDIALLSINSDSTYIFVLGSITGDTKTHLYRGLVGSDTLMELEGTAFDSSSVQKFFVNPHNSLVWAFTQNRIFVSNDYGQSFQIPSKPDSIPYSLVHTLQEPNMAFFGDTSIISFGFSQNPGLVLFQGDSMLTNEGEESDSYSYFLEKSLNFLPKNILLGEIAIVRKNSDAAIVLGTKSQGLFYLKIGDTKWANLNRQRRLDKSLKEVITFPTIFDGSKDVGIGYQIEKTADVTIKVFNYAMEPVRTILNNERRAGGAARSEDPQKDKWDGKDRNGQYVSAGVYYIMIKTSKGEKGWGKVMVVKGREHQNH
ncbi:MAG: hypothetical protein HQK83_10445 [Fibrobacteria bacterium]|nr:hypothetical protein [Fibrobacteria bacterium]